MNQDMDDMPIGFTMSMVNDVKAMNAFASMSDEERHSIVEEAKKVKSKDEVDLLIEKLGNFPL